MHTYLYYILLLPSLFLQHSNTSAEKNSCIGWTDIQHVDRDAFFESRISSTSDLPKMLFKYFCINPVMPNFFRSCRKCTECIAGLPGRLWVRI